MTPTLPSPALAPRAELTPTLLAYAQRAEQVLARVLPAADTAPTALHAAMRYGVLGGGKRIRPLLVYATCTACGGALGAADAAAAAVEIIHAYSLIHDDLPAMDDDALRRGQPTCHIAHGEATAILAGDALQALAFEVLAADPGVAAQPARGVAMLRLLAWACGSAGMAGGQALDLAAVGRQLTLEQLEQMHVRKTGALIRASVQLGALAAGAGDAALLETLARYGHCLGLAFQIRDDILDVEGETEVIGKQQGADQARDKPTYPAALGMRAAHRLADELRHQALAVLQALDLPEMTALEDLAHFAVDRRS